MTHSGSQPLAKCGSFARGGSRRHPLDRDSDLSSHSILFFHTVFTL